jgi:hypothetical protein
VIDVDECTILKPKSEALKHLHILSPTLSDTASIGISNLIIRIQRLAAKLNVLTRQIVSVVQVVKDASAETGAINENNFDAMLLTKLQD